MGSRLRTEVTRWLACERGATAIEYALIAGLFAVMIIAFSHTIVSAWGRTGNKIGGAMPQ